MPETKVRHPLLELTIARLKEFTREPEAVFWVFVFPLLLTLALGFAFREKAQIGRASCRERVSPYV